MPYKKYLSKQKRAPLRCSLLSLIYFNLFSLNGFLRFLWQLHRKNTIFIFGIHVIGIYISNTKRQNKNIGIAADFINIPFTMTSTYLGSNSIIRQYLSVLTHAIKVVPNRQINLGLYFSYCYYSLLL